MTTPLAQWIVPFYRDARYHELVERFQSPEGAITPAHETAMLYALVQQVRPPLSLEIGSFFCHTTRIMAEALRDGDIPGKLITIDPYGQERVPRILKSWPHRLRSLTEYHPWNSMAYFMELETAQTPKGARSPLGVVFVDGHHSFEYALFDIMRSADHLQPAGAIVIDNLEQEGPRTAVLQFLRGNPAWVLFYAGKLAPGTEIAAHQPQWIADAGWGVLLPPTGIQISTHTVKLTQRGIRQRTIACLRLHITELSAPGQLHVNFNYYAVPFDFHLTGKGIESIRQVCPVRVGRKESMIDVPFDPRLALDSARREVNICYELELTYQGDVESPAFVLLDAGQPISLME